MSSLFKKALVFTDLHFGRRGGNPIALQDNLDFLAWAIDKGLTWGADTCLFLGDWHDNRHSISVLSLDASLDGLELLDRAFKRTLLIPGNHDLPYREKRDAPSIVIGRNLPNFQIIRDPCTMDGVTFLPWLVGDEAKKIKALKSRYVFGHLEVPGFLMNARVAMPENDHAIKGDQFTQQEFVWTGHFHKRQHQKFGSTTLSYIGNSMPHDFNDAGDDERGIMLLEWGKDPIYVDWDEQPSFRYVMLSDLATDPEKYLRPKMTVKATMDVVLGFEEQQDFRDTLLKGFDLRKIELVMPNQDGTTVDQEAADQVVFQSVDQTVNDSIDVIDSVGIRKDRLKEIYNGLPNRG